MEIIFNNHLIYGEIFKNLSEDDLYKLWKIDFFKENIQDYLNFSNKIAWERFIDEINVDDDFIEIFSKKLITNCVLCGKIFNLIECRRIKKYKFCSFKYNNEFKSSYICHICDKYCKISDFDCEKCTGNKINGVMIEKSSNDMEHNYHFDDTRLVDRTIYFICCKEPIIKIICICNRKYLDRSELFCLNHKYKLCLMSGFNCNLTCKECFDDWGYKYLI